MSAQACLIGFGPFNKSLVKYRDYPEDWYNDVKEETDVIVHFFNCHSTGQSRKLAGIFNSNLTDFNTHKIIDIKNVNLNETLSRSEIEVKEKAIIGFKKCINAGFVFFFQPNC